MHALKIVRLRVSFFGAARMSSSVNSSAMKYPFLKPRAGNLGPDNPLLELSKPKALREPLAKGIIVPGYFDTRWLTYPEVLDEARSRSIDELHDRVKSYVDSLDPSILTREFPAEVKEKLKSFGAFGALIPKEFGGQGWTLTEFARVMEAFGNNLTLASILVAHNCTVAHSILRHGSKEMKSKYLPKIASGDYICAFAFSEASSGSDMESGKSRGRQFVGEESMDIKGEKIFVTNGLFADLFLTVVSLKHFSAELGDEDSRLTMVLVRRDLPGVIVNKSSALQGLHGNGLASVNFVDTKVSNDDVLGEPGDAAKICRDFISPFRCALSAAVLGALRSAYAKLLADVNTKTRMSRPQNQDPDAQRKILEMATKIYAVESAIYMNAATEDCVEEPNVVIEMSLTGLSGMDYAIEFAETCVDFYGSEAFEKEHFANTLLRDLKCLLWFYQTENLWRLVIAMTSMKIMGAVANERIKILRDPLTYPKQVIEIIRKSGGWRLQRPDDKSPLETPVHPALKKHANSIHYCQEQLRDVADRILRMYGAEIFEYQVTLTKFADIVRDVFLVTVALARANRSLTRGSDSAEFETQLLECILERTHETLKTQINDDLQIEASTLQIETDVFEKLINDGKYTFEHPLMKNF